MDVNDREALGKYIQGAGSEIGTGLLFGIGILGLCSLLGRCVPQKIELGNIEGEYNNIKPFQIKDNSSPAYDSLRRDYEGLKQRINDLEKKR